MTEPNPQGRVQELAERLDCVIEEDLALLADVDVATVRAWRHRGKGPKFYKLGSRALYPTTGLAEWLVGRVREPSVIDAKGLL
jgi:hypothetical protein